MQVDTHIAGAYCVVWINPEEYIEARKDLRKPDLTFLEYVRNGQIRTRATVHNDFAPKSITQWMKELI